MKGHSQTLVVIEGTHGEGGGALLRTALVMSALTTQPVKIQNIRGDTHHPGLDPEDLTLLKALTEICRAESIGSELGSHTLTFMPTARPRGFKGQVSSVRSSSQRGANSLVILSSLLPVLAKSGVYSTLLVEGETYGTNALSHDYFANVTLSALKQAGLYAFPELVYAGFGREAAGKVALDVEPSSLNGLNWTDRGKLLGVRAIAVTSSLPPSVGERIISHLTRMAQNSGLKLQAEHREVEASGQGAFVTAWATYDRAIGGGTAMGAKSVRAEMLAQQAFEELFEWMSSSSTVDAYLADQLVVPLVMAETSSTFSVSRLTQRFLTIVWVVKQFGPLHITVRGVENGPGIVTIDRG